MLDRLREFLPDWGPVAWTAAAFAVLFFGFTGISIYHMPAYEVMYSPSRNAVELKDAGGRFVFYAVNVGNTGRKAQDNVRMRFSRAVMRYAQIEPRAYNSGVVRRDIRKTAEGGEFVVYLGPLEPGHRVTVNFSLSYPYGQRPHEWDEVFLGIEPGKGSARRGDPGMTMVVRAWFTVIGCFSGL